MQYSMILIWQSGNATHSGKVPGAEIPQLRHQEKEHG